MVYSVIIMYSICIGNKACPFIGDMRCASSQACIRSYQWCNQEYDCDDGSDEEYCCMLIINAFLFN